MDKGQNKEKKGAGIVQELARATGVAEADVSKVLDQLGLSRVRDSAMQANSGVEPTLSTAKLAFKIGKSTIIV